MNFEFGGSVMRYTNNTWITNRKDARLYNLNIVPNELTTQVEVDLGDGYCLSKTENIIKNPLKAFHEEHVLKMIEEQKPELLVASESTYIAGDSLNRVIEKAMEARTMTAEKFRQQYEGNFCESCIS